MKHYERAIIAPVSFGSEVPEIIMGLTVFALLASLAWVGGAA